MPFPSDIWTYSVTVPILCEQWIEIIAQFQWWLVVSVSVADNIFIKCLTSKLHFPTTKRSAHYIATLPSGNNTCCHGYNAHCDSSDFMIGFICGFYSWFLFFFFAHCWGFVEPAFCFCRNCKTCQKIHQVDVLLVLSAMTVSYLYDIFVWLLICSKVSYDSEKNSQWQKNVTFSAHLSVWGSLDILLC